MVNPIENYDQNKVTGKEKQVVIIDEAETGETDQLDPKFNEEVSNPEALPDTKDEVDAEGLSNEPAEPQKVEVEDNPGLNRDSDDDLSLNTPQNEIF